MSDLPDWRGCEPPTLKSVAGRFVKIDEARFPEDADALFAAICGPDNLGLWRYIPIGPFDSADEMSAVLFTVTAEENWRTYIMRDVKTDEALGLAAYMRIRPAAGSAEIGSIVFSKKMQRTPIATEAMYLFARHLFDDLGYRRYEWKCHNGNEASKRAAGRFGFTFEGTFRQDMVVRGESRDTAWFAMIDKEWPQIKEGFEAWLAPENFDEEGRQLQSLRQKMPSF